MTNWKETLIAPQSSIRDAIATIDANLMQVAFVVDASHKLLGMITDRDGV